MLVLFDNNTAQRETLAKYLSASPKHLAAIPHTVMEEWHMKKASQGVPDRLRIACQFPRQIVFLKNTAELMRMSGDSRGLLIRLIDRKQTRDFSAYCDTVIKAPMSEEIKARFDDHEAYIAETMAFLTEQSRKMMAVFRDWDENKDGNGFTAKELRELQGILTRGEHLSAELQRKTVIKAAAQAVNHFKRHGLDESKKPRDYPTLVNLLGFRYGAMMVAMYLVWKSSGSKSYPSKEQRVRSWINDLKIAAQAAYLHGFKTDDGDLQKVYEIGRGIVSALGGYQDCGRFETWEQKVARLK
ncbi:MAG TPA: hypothetical protein VF499_16210 [Afipia sp.]